MCNQNKTQYSMLERDGGSCLQTETRGIPGLGKLQYFLYEREGVERAAFGTACEKTYDMRICLQPEADAFAADERKEASDESGGSIATKNVYLAESGMEICDLPDIARSRAVALRLFWQLVRGAVPPCTAEEIITELL